MKQIALTSLFSFYILFATAQLNIIEAKPVKGPLADYIGKKGFSLGSVRETRLGMDTVILFIYPDAMTNYDSIGSFYFKKREDAKELWTLVGKMLSDPNETKKYDIKISTGTLNVSKSKKTVLILNFKEGKNGEIGTGTVFMVDQKIYDKLNIL
jgi:hypothetical protein